MLLPTGTIYRGTAKHHSLIGEVQNAYLLILAQAGRISKGLGFWLKPIHASPPGLETQRLAAG
jgi:hypothetical protein